MQEFKNNIDSSNTKAYVLGFSFALTHTAYDNVDIKGAVKKTFKPNFTGIVTIPNNKEKDKIVVEYKGEKYIVAIPLNRVSI